MAETKLLTIRDASLILSVSEREVMDLVENNKLIAYKVGGVYLRFKREHLEEFKKSLKRSSPEKINTPHKYSFKDRVADLLYFYDFYILSILVILLILIIIFRW